MEKQFNNSQDPIVIIGSGLAGLSAAYDLSKAGRLVVILDQQASPGGLADSLLIDGKPVEKFYHFICRSDASLLELIDELGLKLKLHWNQTHTAFFHEGRMYSFGTPFDLLRFHAIPAIQRLRFGFHILYSRYRSEWRWLDNIPAKPWLIENIGEEAYRAIWHPLLKIKFGEGYEKISAAWVWHRIWRVAKSRRHIWEREAFGFLEDGSFTLVDALQRTLQRDPNINIIRNARVEKIEVESDHIIGIHFLDHKITCRQVLSTIALPTLNRLLEYPAHPYFVKTRKVNYIGVVCVLLSLNRPFSRNFWMNINDPEISFNGIIELTNLNDHLRRSGLNLLYIPYYISTQDPRYSCSDEQLFSEYFGMLQRINPEFEPSWVKDKYIFKAPFAQAVCTTDFADLRPPIRAPIQGLYVTDSTQFYPEDRTLSAAIQQGRRAAAMVLEDSSCHS